MGRKDNPRMGKGWVVIIFLVGFLSPIWAGDWCKSCFNCGKSEEECSNCLYPVCHENCGGSGCGESWGGNRFCPCWRACNYVPGNWIQCEEAKHCPSDGCGAGDGCNDTICPPWCPIGCDSQPCDGAEPCKCKHGEVCGKCKYSSGQMVIICKNKSNPQDCPVCHGTQCCCRIDPPDGDTLMCSTHGNNCPACASCDSKLPSCWAICCRSNVGNVFLDGLCRNINACRLLWKPNGCSGTKNCRYKPEPHIHTSPLTNYSACEYGYYTDNKTKCNDATECVWHYLPPAGTGGCCPWDLNWQASTEQCPLIPPACEVHYVECMC